MHRLRAARAALRQIEGKWKIPILIALGFGPRRFGELAREMEGISAKMLSKELKELEENQLIIRHPHGNPLVAVTYEISPLGQSLDQLLEELHDWGARFEVLRTTLAKSAPAVVPEYREVDERAWERQ